MLKTTRSKQQRKLEKARLELEAHLASLSSPHADTSPKAVQQRQLACQHDTERFLRTYLKHYATSPSASYHEDIDAMFTHGHRHIFVMHGPREHGKSARARANFLRQLLFGQMHYPLMISEELTLSTEHVEFLRTEIMHNKAITSDFEIEEVSWSRTEGRWWLRITPRGSQRTHQVLVKACSYRTKVKGKLFLQYRPDAALIDDFEDTLSSKNPVLGRAKLDWVLQELYPAVSQSAPIVWMGNTGCDTSALYQAMLHVHGDNDRLKAFLKRGTAPGLSIPAWPDRAAGTPRDASYPLSDAGAFLEDTDGVNFSIEDPETLAQLAEDTTTGSSAVQSQMTAYCYRASTLLPTGDTVTLWPERYPDSWYAEMRATMGPAKFDSEMNGAPVREGSFFKREWFPTYKTLPKSGQGGVALRLYSWLDPAFGKSKHACFKFLVLVATDGSNYYIVDAWASQTAPTYEMIEAWYGFFERYPDLRHGGYENNFGQDDRLARDFEDAIRQFGYPLPVAGDANRANKDARIESLQPLASQGRIHWPEHPSPGVEELKAQMLAYPDGFSDGPDALESCIARMRHGAGQPPVYKSFGKRRGRSSRRG